jgi:hypothetical protein
MDSYDVKESPSEKTLSTASSGFQDIALANGVLDIVMSEEAVDKADIIKLLKQPRPSSPPPLDIKKWTKWVAAQKMAQNKEEIKMSMKELFIDWRYQKANLTTSPITPDGMLCSIIHVTGLSSAEASQWPKLMLSKVSQSGHSKHRSIASMVLDVPKTSIRQHSLTCSSNSKARGAQCLLEDHNVPIMQRSQFMGTMRL